MKFTDTHEWITVHDGIGTVGITVYAQQELGDIVYVELPEIGKDIQAGEQAAVLESTKAAADVYSPASGTIFEVNQKLKDESGLINQSPEQMGWLFKLKLAQPDELNGLMDKQQYLDMVILGHK